ncbi:MAG: hypothetical protein AB4372_27845 [Xenococcus sp. (in: cyanobacteria)]
MRPPQEHIDFLDQFNPVTYVLWNDLIFYDLALTIKTRFVIVYNNKNKTLNGYVLTNKKRISEVNWNDDPTVQVNGKNIFDVFQNLQQGLKESIKEILSITPSIDPSINLVLQEDLTNESN